MGVDLEDCSIKQAGRREVLTVIVDKDGGIDLDEIAQISFAISEELDSIEELEEHPFVLEVSSPGTDRPLTEVRHWRRAISRLVNVSFIGDRDDVLIRVHEVDGDQVIGTDAKETDATENAVSFRVTEVDKAVIQIEFNREE
jgi:ribosome maturation factor RimP